MTTHEDNVKVNVANAFKKYRNDNNLKQKELAALLGTNRNLVGKAENCQSCSVPLWLAFCKLAGLDPGMAMEGIEL